MAQTPRCLVYRGPYKPPFGDFAIHSQPTIKGQQASTSANIVPRLTRPQGQKLVPLEASLQPHRGFLSIAALGQEVVWSPAAGSILAGICKGSGCARNKSAGAVGSACVLPACGQVRHGTIALSDLAIRNGLVACLPLHSKQPSPLIGLTLSPSMRCRTDAAVPRMELYSVNQLYSERSIARPQSTRRSHRGFA